jgi:hypothetical protein
LGPFGPRPSAGEAGGLAADGGLPGKIGPASLLEPRGILLGGRMGRELTGAWLVMVMAVKRRGAPVRGRRSGQNWSWSGCQSTPGRAGAHEGRDWAGGWPERPVVDELTEEQRRRRTSDGSTEKELRAPVVRSTSTTE